MILSKCLYLSVRRLSQSQLTLSPAYGPCEFRRCDLLNGIKICASKSTGTPITACTIMFQAGSRYEVNDDIGATHFIRAMSSGSGCGFSACYKMRTLQYSGAYLTCTSDRQTVAFTLRCPLQMFSQLKHYLLDTAIGCCYYEWETSDRKQLVKDDLFRMKPVQRVLDLVQKAFWAGPLANSVFCEEGRISNMSGETLKEYAKRNFTSANCTIASIGIPYEETLKLAETVNPLPVKPHTEVREYKSRPRSGFEYYDLGPGSDTWIALAIPGCGTCDLSCLLKHAILAAACGTGFMQKGQHNIDRTLEPPLGLLAGKDVFTDYRAFNIAYYDTGIFGILCNTRSCSASNAAFAAAEFLSRIGNLTSSQIKIGKTRLKMNLLKHEEDYGRSCESMALQLANNFQMTSINEMLSLVDMISPNDVLDVASSLAGRCSEMAVAYVGDVGVAPTDQEILSACQ